MVFNKIILRFLCDRFVISKLSAYSIGDKIYYIDRINENRLNTKHRDDFLFELCEVQIDDYVYDMYRKFYIRPSKEVTKELVNYVKDILDNNVIKVIKDNGSLMVVNSLVKDVVGYLLNQK